LGTGQWKDPGGNFNVPGHIQNFCGFQIQAKGHTNAGPWHRREDSLNLISPDPGKIVYGFALLD
jgi:hypothetical protein